MLNRAADGYRCEGKTDAPDATVIADQARMRRDLHPPRLGDDNTANLVLLTTRRPASYYGQARPARNRYAEVLELPDVLTAIVTRRRPSAPGRRSLGSSTGSVLSPKASLFGAVGPARWGG
jgi:hypothetical protein